MENEKIKELEANIDSYGIQLLLMKAQFATLEQSVMHLASHLLGEKANQTFLENHFDTLKLNSFALYTPHEFPFSKSKMVKELIQLELYANAELKKLK